MGRDTTIVRLTLAISAALFLGLVGAMGQSGESTQPPKFKTPQEAFDAVKTAADKGDIRGLCALLSDDSRDYIIGGLLAYAAGIQAGENDPFKNDKAKIEAVLAKHGITADGARNIL